MAQRERAKNLDLATKGVQRPVNIIEIYKVKGSESRSKYVLKADALRKLLEPVKNLEVVIIAIVGRPNGGKSFLLNYMSRFLANYKNSNGWMGSADEPLQGFDWGLSSDSKTSGIWLSQPFIVKQSNGKEMAVLLMDTQSIFDEFEPRDRSTIVGISLLMSSCLIFNVMTDTSDDIMSNLDSYINYGLKAIQSNAGAKDNVPFQTLLFLIRDWNSPNELKYGLKGGQQYLDNKLFVGDNKSLEKIFGHNLKKCFQEVMCFLMPQFGEVKEDFDGAVNKLRERFREKLKEFISTLLNPEELVPKMIYGTPITAEELYQQFQSFFELFNDEELPESQAIFDANNKFFDSILIRKIKDRHMNQLQAFIHSKPFVTRKELETQHQSYKTENIESFEIEMKSNNPSLVDKLCQHLNKNYEMAFNENEVQRDNYIQELRDVCSQQFNEALNKELTNNGYVEPQVLDELFKTNAKEVTNFFKAGYGGEEESLFKDRFFEFCQFINNLEKVTRTENYHRIKEFETTKEQYLVEVVEFYNQFMTKLLEESVYLSKDQFKKEEQNIRSNTETKCRQEFNLGNQSANENFYLKVNQKLNESKLMFKEQNKDKTKSIVEKAEKISSDSVEKYRNEMIELMYLIQNVDNFEISHQRVFGKWCKDMQNCIPFKDNSFLNHYIESFNRETQKLYDYFKIQLMQRIQSRRQKYETALNEAKNHYIEGMTKSMEEKEFFSAEELNRNNRNHRKSALKVYDSLLEGTDQCDPFFKGYQSDLKDFIEEEFDNFYEKNEQIMKSDGRQIDVLLDQSLKTFHKSMAQFTQTSISDIELSNNFEVLKEKLIKDISDNNTVSDKFLLKQKMFEFESQLNESFKEFKSQLEKRKTSVLNDYEVKVTRSRDSYKQMMEGFLKTNPFITGEEFDEYHESTKLGIISELTKQLKPLFDIEVHQFVDTTEQLIANEYQNYFKANETKRNNSLDLIQKLSKVSIIEYKNRMTEGLEVIPSEDNLIQKHCLTLDEILQRSKHSTALPNDKLISIQSTYIESEVSSIFEQILKTFRENKSQLNEKLEEKSRNIKESYKKTMETALDSLQSEDDLNKKHCELSTQLMEKLNDCIQTKDSTLLKTSMIGIESFMTMELTDLQKKLNEKIETNVKSYKTMTTLLTAEYIQNMDKIVRGDEILSKEEFQKLHELHSNKVIDSFEDHLKEHPCSEGPAFCMQFKKGIEEEFLKQKEKFEWKRNLKLKDLELAVSKLGRKYESDIKEVFDSVYTKEELGDSHKKVKEKLITDFKKDFRFKDSDQIKPYIEKLEESFETFLEDFDTILELKMENRETIVKSIKQDIRRFYKEEMEKCFQNKLYVQKQLVNKFHKLVLRKAIDKFRSEKGDISEGHFSQLAADSVVDIFNKVSDDNEMKRPTDSPAIGIDLGTTNSCVAYFKPDKSNPNNVIVIPNEFGHLTTPSVVSYRENSIVSVGDEAKEVIHQFPRNTISSVKRLIGRQYNDENVQNDMNLWSYKVVDDGQNNPQVSLKVDGQDKLLFPEQISGKVLRKMKEIAETHLGCEVNKAVITVPAYFNDGQKEATKDAGKLAGLEVLRIINEPTAAAIAFKVDRNEETETRNVLIYDFGGGTFDVSILVINRGKIEVKAVDGDNHLGGDDIDTSLIKYCLEEFEKVLNVKVEGVEGEAAMCRLRNKCEEHKKRLTAVESTVIEIDNFYQNNDLRVALTRDKFEELNNPLFEKSIDLVQKALKGKNINPSQIDDVVLVGGTTRIPKIQEMLSKFFGGKALNHWVNPDEAVAKGAAIQAAYLNGAQLSGSGSNEMILKDVTPLSLGVQVVGNWMSVMLPRNSPVPSTLTREYVTTYDYQTSVVIMIFEGEERVATDNHLLGKFTLQGIPSAPQGEEPIDVTFSLNDEGILKVKAVIRSTGGEKDIEINEHKGRLTAEKIEQLMSEENFNQTFGSLFK